MPPEWSLNIIVPMYTWKGPLVNCHGYGAMKLLESGMMMTKRVFEKDF